MGFNVAVTPYDITIYINGVDVTANVPLDTALFDDYATEVSTFNMLIQNPSGVTPSFGQSVVVYWNSAPEAIKSKIFEGYVINVKNRKYDNGIVIEYEVECQDKKVLLQKSIIEFNEFSGSLASVLSSMFSAAYPDLTSLFDYSSMVDSLGNIDVKVNDESLLDTLNKIADYLGTDFAVHLGGLSNTVTYDANGLGSPTGSITVSTINNKGDLLLDEDSSGLYTTEIETNGNPGNCYHGTGTRSSPNPGVTIRTWINVTAIFGEAKVLSGFGFDYKATTPDNDCSISIRMFDAGSSVIYEDLANSSTADGTWISKTQADYDAMPATAVHQIYVLINGKAQDGAQELRMDNFSISLSEQSVPGFGDGPFIDIGPAPDSDFNLDIDTSDEFASDIELDTGEFAFNSVTVTGGDEEVPIDWIFESDGSHNQFDVPTEIFDYQIYKNTNSDPPFVLYTLLTDGIYGKDDLIDDGGSAEVLYDPENHWLLFDSSRTPENLRYSFRVIGNVRRPIRVRVENVGAGDPTLAESVYDDSITTEANAAAKGAALLNKQTEVKRMTFKTHNPGLRPGTKITVTDTNRGLNESLVIRHIATRWLGAGGNAEFSVECGPVNYARFDMMFADTEKRLKPKPGEGALTVIGYGFLVDADDDFVIDANDNRILSRSS